MHVYYTKHAGIIINNYSYKQRTHVTVHVTCVAVCVMAWHKVLVIVLGNSCTEDIINGDAHVLEQPQVKVPPYFVSIPLSG